MAATRFVGKRKKKEKKKLFVKSGLVWLCGGGGKVGAPAMGLKKTPNHFRTRPLNVQTMEQFLDLKRHLNTFCFSLLQTMSL